MEVKETNAAHRLTPEHVESFRHTEVGLLPTDWRLARLHELADIRTGIAKNSGAVIDNPVIVHYLRVANVQDGYLDLSEMSQLRVRPEDVKRYAVLAGDMLMNEGGDLDKLGRGALWTGEFEPCVHQNHVFVVRCGSQLLPEFLSAWTGSVHARRFFMLAGRQTTNLASINKTSLGQFPVPLPSTKAEQKAIAEALSDINSLIENLSLLLAKKRQIKQGAMQELLTGRKRLPGFTGEWGARVLGQSASLKARIGWQGLTTKEYLDSGDFFLVTGTEIHDGEINWDECKHVDAVRYKQDVNIQLQMDDVLVTKDGTIGKVGIVAELPKPATLNSGVFVIRPISKAFHPRFFYYLLCSSVFSDFLEQLAAGSTISHLYQKDFVKFAFRLPPTEDEQKAIARALTDMDADVSAIGAKLSKARKLKQGMMQELLTGRIRLTRKRPFRT
ncbi:restriction endonuclease subunit S [Burkholderia sp. AU6039]|uniref:restriction endonuclease subunit S n=1 Tax=Burkholderia sp. AU6039 TaxID=2015344 RepID=UPI000B79B5E0|nr:restriction endonuclease subunit S [Burkholderia sp. AU6039]OXJ21297.1 type I restriction endonuclease subunit S [Burkholderia sp. AU6039]